MVEGLPTDYHSLYLLQDRVGCRRNTHYGDGFHVVNKENPSNLAYAGVALALHVDQPEYGYNPGVKLFYVPFHLPISKKDKNKGDDYIFA